MARKQQTTGQGRGFIKDNNTRPQKNTNNKPVLKGFCSPCVYFRLIKLKSGFMRRFCAFTGEKLTPVGNPLCEFREGGI